MNPLSHPTSILLVTLAGISTLVLIGFGLVSWRENERRAGTISFSLAFITAIILGWIAFSPLWVRYASLAILGLALLAAVILFLGLGNPNDHHKEIPKSRQDERDIMFARARLIPNSPEYEAYYALRPKNKAGDDLTRSKPGLLSLKASHANPYIFAASQGSFTLTEALSPAVEGPVSSKVHTLPPQQMTAFVKNLARYYGALDVGIAELKPYHLYSHIGRGSGVYGAAIHLEHRYAVAITVEMDSDCIGANPEAPGVAESARQYVETSRVAIQLAAAIRYLGHDARAHIDGNYRVICPLVARDAGLGEIGRMGILMTPRQGPRVRLAVVTTHLDLVPDEAPGDPSVIDFCRICLKCAHNCPVKAIPFDDRQPIDGALRWRINADTCYRYWTVVGTDCGRCMTVCPYSHPDNIYHNLIRLGIKKSRGFRTLALWMDDLFYGNRPTTRPWPEWARVVKK